jgi:hypothetical protein
MALDPLTAGIEAGKAIIDKIWPDKTEQEKQRLAGVIALVQGQMAVNQTEAAHPSVFVSGWRPFIGWVCGAACAWNWIGLPIAKLGAAFAGVTITLAPADLTEMMPVLMGMLGLGALRTYEKTKRVARR